MLGLPNEVLAHVLLRSSSPSLMQLIFTCKQLFNLTAVSRQVLLAHLSRIPGGQVGFDAEAASTEELFLVFRRRAVAALQGLDLTADRHDIDFAGELIDPPASSLGVMKDQALHLAIVRRATSDIGIYQVSHRQLRLVSIMKPGACDGDRPRIRKTVFDNQGNFFALTMVPNPLRSSPTSRSEDREPGWWDVGENARVLRPGSAKWGGPRKKREPESDVAGDGCGHHLTNLLRDLDRWIPLSMSAYGGTAVAIAWSEASLSSHVDECCAVNELVSLPRDQVDDLGGSDGRASASASASGARQVTESKLLLTGGNPTRRIDYSRGGGMIRCYSERLPCCPAFRLTKLRRLRTMQLGRNVCWLKDSRSRKHPIYLDDAFFVHHHDRHDRAREAGGPCCCPGLSIGVSGSSTQASAYVVRHRVRSREADCFHSEQLEPRVSRWNSCRAVAQLQGFPVQRSSLPRIWTSSPKATRIAVADWKQVLVWPLWPELLAGTEAQMRQAFPDRSYDWRADGVIPDLRPITLSGHAVVHELAFAACEDELVAITDRGVQIWHIGAFAAGRRTTSPSPRPTSQANVPCLPASPSSSPRRRSDGPTKRGGSGGGEGVFLQRWMYSPRLDP